MYSSYQPISTFSEPISPYSEPLSLYSEPLTPYFEPLPPYSEPLPPYSEPISVVNAVLLKLRPDLYQSRYNPSAINGNQDTNSSAINVKPMYTILSVLNVTQDTSVAIKHVLNRSMPNQWAQSYRL